MYVSRGNRSTLDRKEAMNEQFIAVMLGNQCPSDLLENDWRLFTFEFCCMAPVEVEARKDSEKGWVIRSVKVGQFA